jgi:hypothetical protein
VLSNRMQTTLENTRFTYQELKNDTDLLSLSSQIKSLVYTHKDLELANEELLIEFHNGGIFVGHLVLGPPSKLTEHGLQYHDWGGEDIERVEVVLEKSMAIKQILLENCSKNQLEDSIKKYLDTLGTPFQHCLLRIRIDEGDNAAEMVLDIFK